MECSLLLFPWRKTFLWRPQETSSSISLTNFTDHLSAPRSITGKGECGQGWLKLLRICLLRFSGLLSHGMESYCSINIKDGGGFSVAKPGVLATSHWILFGECWRKEWEDGEKGGRKGGVEGEKSLPSCRENVSPRRVARDLSPAKTVIPSRL